MAGIAYGFGPLDKKHAVSGSDAGHSISRRTAMFGGCAALLSGCAPTRNRLLTQPDPTQRTALDTDPASIYAAMHDDDKALPQVNYRKLDPKLWRRRVIAPAGALPGTILVRLKEYQLFLIGHDGMATRYGIGIGAQGYSWAGKGEIAHKRAWPRWTPPTEMIARHPELAQYRVGKPGGIDNPLGARALYIFHNGADTLYRMHGTPEWWTIGRSMSSGCIRMINQDVIDLYERTCDGTPLLVMD